MIGERPSFVLDSNAFMEPARHYYAFDIVPSFWHALIEQAKTGQIQSIDRVKLEIDRGKDDLSAWINGNFQQWFTSTDEDGVLDAYRRIIIWANEREQFTDAAKAEINRAENADAWLVAFALSKNCVVVTHEKRNLDIKKRIPIPNVCEAFGVKYINICQMLRMLGIKI